MASQSQLGKGPPMAKIVIEITDDAGIKYSAKITGTPASSGLDSLYIYE